MLNPKIKEIFDNEDVINALSIFSNACEQRNLKVGIWGTGVENDVRMPRLFVSDLPITVDIRIIYSKALFSKIEDDPESYNNGYILSRSVPDSAVSEVVPLWVI